MESLWHKYLVYLNLHVLVVGCGRVGQSFSDFHNISLKYNVWRVWYQIHCVLEKNSKIVFGYPGRLSTHLNSMFLKFFSNNSYSSLPQNQNAHRRPPGSPSGHRTSHRHSRAEDMPHAKRRAQDLVRQDVNHAVVGLRRS